MPSINPGFNFISAHMDGIDLNPVAVVAQVDKGASGGCDSLEFQTLMEASNNPSQKNGEISIDSVRVIKEAKGVDGEVKFEVRNSENVVKEVGAIKGLRMDDKSNEILIELSVDENPKRDSMVADTENKITEILSSDDVQESVDVMELVGNDNVVDVFADLNAGQSVILEPVSTNGTGDEGTAVGKSLDKGNLNSIRNGAGLNEKQYVVTNENASDGKLENVEGIHVSKPGVLIPMRCGEHCVTNKEDQYYVSDLVWAKLRSHQWWPGQIFELSDASKRAMTYFKKDSYLISYFDDRTLAWSEASNIKPFQMHFSQMEKQSNTKAFWHAVSRALDEVARRVELVLSCPCLPKVLPNENNSQVVDNVGRGEESIRRDGRDDLSCTSSFLPEELVRYLKSLAGAPRSRTDRLEFVMMKARLVAFNRWKGHHQLPFFEELRLLDFGGHITKQGGARHSQEVMEGELPGSEGANKVPSKKKKLTPQNGSSRKRKYRAGSDQCMASSSPIWLNGEKAAERKTGWKKVSSGKIHEPVDFLSSNPKMKRRKARLSPRPSDKITSQPEKYLSIGQRMSTVFKCDDRSLSQSVAKSGEKLATTGLCDMTHGNGISHEEKMIPAECPPPDEIHSKLCLAAKDPTKGHDFLSPIVSVLSEFRNSICLGKNNEQKLKKHAWKHERGQSSNLESKDTFGFEDVKDSYWTDLIIQNSEDQVPSGPETSTKKDAYIDEPEIAKAMQWNKGDKQENDSGALSLEIENRSGFMDDDSKEYYQTSLILNFTNLESIPSITNLNEISSCYGLLHESETKVFSKSKRAKVIFKRRADAENAFDDIGKFHIFGPSLLSYRLNYSAIRPKAPPTSKRNRKTTFMEENAV